MHQCLVLSVETSVVSNNDLSKLFILWHSLWNRQPFTNQQNVRLIQRVFRRHVNSYSNGEIRLLTLSQTSPGFYVSTVQVFLKTLWEKDKLLSTSNLSFPQCFLPVWIFSIRFEIVICKLFQMSRV